MIRVYVTNPVFVEDGALNSYTLYDVITRANFEPAVLGNNFKTKKRYSAFDLMRTRLAREQLVTVESLPVFPEKKFIGMRFFRRMLLRCC